MLGAPTLQRQTEEEAVKVPEREQALRQEGTGRQHGDMSLFPELHLCSWPKRLLLPVTAGEHALVPPR